MVARANSSCGECGCVCASNGHTRDTARREPWAPGGDRHERVAARWPLRLRREARGAANPKGERRRRPRGGEWSARGSRRDKIPRESAAGGLRNQAACRASGRELHHRALAKERDASAKTVYREPEAAKLAVRSADAWRATLAALAKNKASACAGPAAARPSSSRFPRHSWRRVFLPSRRPDCP